MSCAAVSLVAVAALPATPSGSLSLQILQGLFLVNPALGSPDKPAAQEESSAL